MGRSPDPERLDRASSPLERFAQGRFGVGIRRRSFRFGDRSRVERHAAGAASEDRGQIVKLNDGVEAGAAGVFLEFASSLGSGLDHFLVEQPFLEVEG